MRDHVEEAEKAQYRASMYTLAGTAFAREPALEELRALISFARTNAGGPALLVCESALMQGLSELDDSDFDRLLTQVRTHYCELFVGPRAPLAPPSESRYTGWPRRAFTEVTRAVRDVYRSQGLQVGQKNNTPDDHVSLECEFMAHLCSLEAAAWEANDEDGAMALRSQGAEFLEKHLGRWASAFADKVCEAHEDGYYALWARFLEAFVGTETERLGVSPTELDDPCIAGCEAGATFDPRLAFPGPEGKALRAALFESRAKARAQKCAQTGACESGCRAQ